MNAPNESKESANKNDKLILVLVKTPQGEWENEFLKTDKILDVLNAVIKHFGFDANGKYDLRLADNIEEALDGNRPLVSYGFTDGVILIFSDLGIAV